MYFLRPRLVVSDIVEDLDRWKLVLPRKLRAEALRESHDASHAGHLGVEKTYHRVAVSYYWPNLFRDMAKHVRTCDMCQRTKVEQSSPAGWMGRRTVEGPWTAVAADIIGPLPRSKAGYQYLLVVQSITIGKDRRITSFYTKIFRENVEYRQAHKVIKHDFMNLLIQLMEKGYVGDDKKTTDVTSGFETSTATATFALYELAHHQDKVYKEIDETLTKHDLTYDAMNKMPYLTKVINETLRKYPPLSMLNHICTKVINLPTTNIYLLKETSIFIPILGLHRDPSIYPNPDKFDPERFNADEKARRHPYAYLPFGEGPRICIGDLDTCKRKSDS
ncbi:cytochrome P450 6k1-like [Temnothorax americanus]|uniref:cytochrome P450 6k1-like n=1 Tax=Temnothorax americanus TaxID=1964332 RepID=UPI004068DC90